MRIIGLDEFEKAYKHFEKNEIHMSVEMSDRSNDRKIAVSLAELTTALETSTLLTMAAIQLGIEKNIFTTKNFFQ